MRAVLRIVWLSATLASAYMLPATPRSGLRPAACPSRTRIGATACRERRGPPRPRIGGGCTAAPSARRERRWRATKQRHQRSSSTTSWLQLGYSRCSRLLGLVCFSAAAPRRGRRRARPGDADRHLPHQRLLLPREPVLVAAWAVQRGRRRGGADGAGCALRSGVPFSGDPAARVGTLPSARRSPSSVHAAAALGGLVGADRRALDAVAINFNQVGIATASSSAARWRRARRGSASLRRDHARAVVVAIARFSSSLLLPTPPSARRR